jgi:hypothetical protein
MSTQLSIFCPDCRCSFTVRPAYVGTAVGCRYCDQVFLIEAAADPTVVPSRDASAGVPPPGTQADFSSFAVAVFGPAGSGTHRTGELAHSDRDASGPGVAVVQFDTGRTLPGVVPVLASELEALQAEIERLGAEWAEAECRHDAVVRRSEELARTIAELRDERDRHRSNCGSTTSAARVPAVEVTMTRARTDEGWADHHPSERFRAVVTTSVPHDGGPAARSEWLPKLRSVTSSPFSVPEEEASKRTFPREADLALVRAQVDVLNELLRTGPATGHVLIYQQRLIEFALKIREASRLASSLANEVEQTRQRDEMQYHMYLLRRAGEIDKDL